MVHPLLNRDRSLTHRKIAAMPAVPSTETVVSASVKRWRTQQAVVEGHLLKERPDEQGSVS
ncbi:MAG TPA: hypothetical protein VFV38_07875 [Ktedonobacteraceae bacterium]|nr:hypothetical protein [Ktedonobacteraceae bacterium]